MNINVGDTVEYVDIERGVVYETVGDIVRVKWRNLAMSRGYFASRLRVVVAPRTPFEQSVHEYITKELSRG